MTDQELKDLITSLAIQSAKTDLLFAESAAQLKENAIQIAKTEAQLAKTDAQIAKTDAQLAKTDAQLAKTDAQLAKTDAQLAKTDAQLAKTDAKLERIGIRLGNMADNHGYVTEDYFYNALAEIMSFGGIKYDEIAKNIHVKSKRMEDEFDLVMYNGNSIALIECKYKAHKKDVENLINKKVTNFRITHPDFANYKIYLGIASFGFYPEIEEYAKENGIAILKQKGEITEIQDKNLKVY